ncbi:hypothetical protein ANO11243_055430 [Dothideomycetidae sp. 11243]|nr:hypothetical protein ANO11243_055430 [fungal sp. No.11243]
MADFDDVAPDQLWYFAPITAVDKSGYLWIAGILCLVYILSFMLLRLFANRRQLRLNDYVSVVATQSSPQEPGPSLILTFDTITDGLQAIYATVIFFIAAHTAAKVSMALLSQKLFAIYKQRLCQVAIGLAGSWGVLALLLLLPKWSPACSSSAPFSTTCYPVASRWYAVAALDLASELVLFSVPAISLVPLRMGAAAKTGVLAAFASRAASTAPVFVCAAYVSHAQTGRHPWAGLAALVALQIALAASLATTNASALRSLTRPVKSVLGGASYSGYRYGEQYLTTATAPERSKTGKTKGKKLTPFDGIQVQTEIHLDAE